MVNGTEATEAIFMGNGTVNGINVTSMGKALVIPRSNGAAYIEGTADFKTSDNGKVERQLMCFRQLEIMVLLSLILIQQEAWFS
jgi:hypothetical protein